MAQILALSADWKEFPRQFAKLARHYPVALTEFSKLGERKFDDSTILLIDFHKLTFDHFKTIRPHTREAKVQAIALVDMGSRQLVFQARELGISYLLSRQENLSALLVILREVLGDYSKPKLPEGTPIVTARAVQNTSSTLNMMSIAALAGAPLPMKKLAGSAKEIGEALGADGLDMWLTAVQSHHSHTYCHTMMVAGHAVNFAKTLGMSVKEQYLMGLGGLVHDLGKVKIPLSILDKPGKLTPKERALVNKHTIYSQELLEARSEVPQQVVEMALWHHEFIDGSGYPNGLVGDQIPERVRLMTIVDIYSALTEKRSYKDKVSPYEALSIMAGMDGKLDSTLLRKFRNEILNSDFGRVNRSAS